MQLMLPLFVDPNLLILVGVLHCALTLRDIQDTCCGVVSPGILLLFAFDATPQETFLKFLKV